MPQQLSFTIVATVQNPLSVVQPPAGPDPRPITVAAGGTYQIVAAGGVAPYSYQASGLPAGWSLNPTSGLLTAGSVGGTFQVTVTDSSS